MRKLLVRVLLLLPTAAAAGSARLDASGGRAMFLEGAADVFTNPVLTALQGNTGIASGESGALFFSRFDLRFSVD